MAKTYQDMNVIFLNEISFILLAVYNILLIETPFNQEHLLRAPANEILQLAGIDF